jgi:5-methylcytosine-specific restriction endonuclease McrA
MEYFRAHPNVELEHGRVVDWVTEQWLKEHDAPPRDPWRAIRKFHQEGKLVKVRKGVYKYDPELVHDIGLWDFPQNIKKAVLERDGHRCVVCGRGLQDSVELVVDHIKPKDRGGTNDIENGQTLCTEHNLLKKNYSQTEAAKRYFIKMYQKAVSIGDERMTRFCQSIFDVYDDFEVDGHIARPDTQG